MDIQISHQLEIMPGDILYLPGCEPTSAVTSRTLNAMIAQACPKSTVQLADALKAIPGSYVKFGTNYNRRGVLQKWLVLPSREASCPCPDNVDYFSILKSISHEESETYDYSGCDMASGYNPSPEFLDFVPPKDPYVEEGSFMGTGFLPPIPPWNLGGSPD